MRARVWAYASHGVLCRWSSDVVVYACEGGWVGFRMVYLSVSGRFYTFQVCVYGGKVIYRYILNEHKWWTRWRGRRRGTGRRRAGIARARDSSVDRSVGGLVRDPSVVVYARSRSFGRSFGRSVIRSTARRRFESNRIEIDRFRDENRRFDRASPRGGDFGSIARRARDESVREGRPWVGLIDCIDFDWID